MREITHQEESIAAVAMESQSEVEKGTISEAERLHQFLTNEDNKQQALSLAMSIEKTMGRDWFSLNQFLAKTRESKESGFYKLHLCKMFDLVQTRLGSYSDKTSRPLFKVTISKEYQIRALRQMIDFYSKEISLLNQKIAQLGDVSL